ncbi:MAG TPA: M28 family peptidase [Chryseolinea sp.]|nr:M28 family peptidase [Chryseolinea sp.]
MRILIYSFLLFTCVHSIEAQKKINSKIDQSVTAAELEAHLSFLASDEMRGRNTGSPEIDIAASYIATQFKLAGIKPGVGASYFQNVELERINSPKSGEITIGQDVLKLKDDFLLLSGGSARLDKEIVFIGYGTIEDFQKIDVKDKIVVAYAGLPTSKNPVQAVMTDGPQKKRIATSHGASALIEIMALPGVPWPGLTKFLSAERMITKTEKGTEFPHLLLRNFESPGVQALKESKSSKGSIVLEAGLAGPVSAKNVLGIIEGSDPSLKQEWIAISAHYDHVGVTKLPNNPDSIYNGARDNAIGTVALIEAAKFFGQNKPKRSILFLALTAEEKGLRGSEWYSEHAVIPLEKTVLNFNCDGAGYNDTTIATVIDFNRTTVDPLLIKACQAYGLTLKGDPAPEQNLYERSDNVNFAAKGVPAVNISPGVKAFDSELFKYYHQPADEVGTLDMHYLEKFFRVYVYASYLLANEPQRPAWVKGDKFEEAGKKLYAK